MRANYIRTLKFRSRNEAFQSDKTFERPNPWT